MKRWIFIILMVLAAALPLSAQVGQDALELYRNGQHEQAVEACLNELVTYSDSQVQKRMNAYSVLNWSLLALGRYREMVTYGEEALQYAQNDYRIVLTLGQAHSYLGNNLDALWYFEQYIQLSETMNLSADTVALVYYYMGEVFLRLAEYHHADIAFSTGVYYKPENARWWQRLGYAREQAGDAEWALQAYQKAQELDASLNGVERSIERVAALAENP